MKAIKMKKTVAERFWSKVDIRDIDECWVWTRSLKAKGYGQFRVHPAPASPQTASRVAWQLANGPIPDGLFVCHACDNPPCCNPNHLFLGMPIDNTRDMIRKGRARYVGGRRKLSQEDVAEVWRLLEH